MKIITKLAHTILCIILVVFSLNATAQKDTLVTADFNGLTAESFFRQIEETTPYHFFYDVKQLDSVRINLSVKDQPVASVLKQAFSNTDILFSIDAQNRVFITRKVKLLTNIPSEFFQKAPAPALDKVNTVVAFANNNSQKTSFENKIYEIGIKNQGKDKAILTGRVVNERTGEPVINASLFIEKLNMGVITDQYGYYTINLPAGLYTLSVQSIGMKDSKYQVHIYSDGALNIELKEQVRMLKEVVVSAQKGSNITRQMGVERLNIDVIKRVPTVFGEADVMKVVLTLPGVKTVGEMWDPLESTCRHASLSIL